MRTGFLAITCTLLTAASCQKTAERDEAPASANAPVTETSAEVEPSIEHDVEPEFGMKEDTRAAEQAEKPSPTSESLAKRRYIVAALGDSITDSRSVGGGYLKVLRKLCPKSQFLDFGKGGDMTNQMRARWLRDILPQSKALKLDTLLVFGGVNDLYSDLTAGRTNDRIETDLSKIYDQARKAKLEVVAVTVSPWGGFTRYFNERRGQNTRLLNSWILARVAENEVDHVVDSFPLLSCGDSDSLCPKYETRSHDGLHPGTEGHRLLGEKLHEVAFSDCL